MQYTIKNDYISLTVDSFACEMHSLKKNDSDHEYLWQADPKFWSGRNPTLFPLVGSLPSKQVFLKGKYYEMKNHGFARTFDYELLEKGNDYLLFELKQNEETLKMYPYYFRLQIKYSLDEYKVNINYNIINDNNEDMPFSFGLHPAFNIDLNSKTLIELKEDGDVIPDDSLFEKYETYILDPVKSKECRLITGNNELKVYFDGYPILAIWRKKGAPYVCIEPWHSGSLSKANIKPEDFTNWKWTIHLKEKECWKTGYSIEIVK